MNSSRAILWSGVCLVVLSGVFGYTLVARFADDVRRTGSSHELVLALNRLRSALDLAGLGARSYVSSEGRVSLQPYRRALAELEAPLRTVAPFARLRPDDAPFTRLAPAIKNELLQLQTGIDAQRAGRHEDASRALAALAATGLEDRIKADLDSVEQSVRADLAREAERSEAVRRWFMAALALCLLGVGAILLQWQRRFARELADRQQTAAALRRQNETLQSFAHTVAHDLRAPLRGIAGYSRELAAQSAGLDPRSQHCLAQIDSSARHLERLIDGTLAFTAVDAATPALVTVDLPALVAALLRQRAPQIREYRTEIVTHFDVAAVRTWEQGLSQVLGNLIDNAVKYSRHARPPRVRITSTDTPAAWRLLVEDNGIGFDMAHHDRMFALFQRLPNSREFEGTGAGLALVRKVLDRLGGTVRAEGRPGAGAAFFVELPKTPAPALT